MTKVNLTASDTILARGAARGLALEWFGPVWGTARLRLARASWGQSGLDPFLTSDVPYTGTSSGRLSGDAVEIFLTSVADAGKRPLRVLELGAGSGIFAKLFLDRLRDCAPDIYARTSYVVSDGSASVLAAQASHGVLAAHAGQVETRVLDVTGDWGALGPFDAILGTYILDSLPFDLLAVKDGTTWRKEGRSVVDDADASVAEPLRAALSADTVQALNEWLWIGPRLGMQTRHVAVTRSDLPFADSLPGDTGGQTIPFVHCHGALACLDTCRRVLRPGGVAVFSDYGHLAHLPAHEFLEFQSFGTSVAVGVNFAQLSTGAAIWPDAVLYAPAEEEGNLHTRVLHRGGVPDPLLGRLVEALYGAARHRMLNDLLEKARAMVKSRFYESARSFYRQALAEQPDNWAIMEEVASFLLLATKENEAALDMVQQGLARNPLSPGLWLARGEAFLALERRDEARAAIEHLIMLAPGLASSWRALAELELQDGNHLAALDAVASGLKNDRDCDEQEELLQIQSKILAAKAEREHQTLLAGANQFRALDGLPD